jgi:superfamily II DNA or RNA helicase
MEILRTFNTTNTISVAKINEVFMSVHCDASIEQELSEHFCFFVPGYKFMPAYRNRMWDGKIRLYDFRRKTLYNGLYKYLKEFAAVRNYEVIPAATSGYGTIGEVQKVDIKRFISPLVLSSAGLGITPRNYQIDALSVTLQEKKTLLLSPTASGKSLIIYMAIKWYLENHDKRILIIVPTTSLVEQLYSDFADYCSQDPSFNSEEECYRIYGGADRYNIEQRVIISTWQSIYKLSHPWFKEFGMVIGDEAHQFKAKSLTSIMEKCTEAEYRMGTTGTLDGTQTHQLVLEGLFGPVKQVTTTKELMQKDQLAQLDIDIILLKYADEFAKENRTYQEEIDFIVGYQPRNNFIANLALDQDGNTLILFNYVEKHGKPLHDLLSKKVADGRKLFYVSGETDVDTRESVRAITEKEDNAIIVASLGTFSTGINIRRLHNLIFASPSKSQIRVLQSIGRGLRKSDRNTKVFDIADDLHWKNRKNYTLQHAAERIKIYSKERFNYNMWDINI